LSLTFHTTISFDSMKKSTDAPVRLMQISAPISPPLSAGQNNPYRDIGVGRPPPGRGKKPSGQRVRQEQHEVSTVQLFLVWEGEANATGALEGEAMFLLSAWSSLPGHSVLLLTFSNTIVLSPCVVLAAMLPVEGYL